jgi:hypothetical protein
VIHLESFLAKNGRLHQLPPKGIHEMASSVVCSRRWPTQKFVSVNYASRSLGKFFQGSVRGRGSCAAARFNRYASAAPHRAGSLGIGGGDWRDFLSGAESVQGCSVVMKPNDIALIVVFVAVLALGVAGFFFPDLLSHLLSY